MVDIKTMTDEEFNEHKRKFYSERHPAYDDLTPEEREYLQKAIKSGKSEKTSPEEAQNYIRSIINSRK